MKNLIVNADDFGLSRSINQGIIEAFRQGIVTSTSLMVNMPGFEDALVLMAKNPALGVGLHVNFLRGWSVSQEKGRDVLGRGEHFSDNIGLFLARIYWQGIRCIEKECRAQIEKALGRGVRITHLDSEKNMHMVPVIFEMFVRVAHDYGIGKIRNINEDISSQPYSSDQRRPSLQRQLTVKYFNHISRQNKGFARQYEIKTPDHFLGFLNGGAVTFEVFEEMLQSVGLGTTELVCHPGRIDDEWARPPLQGEHYYINSQRMAELKVLMLPGLKETVRGLGINLINFREF